MMINFFRSRRLILLPAALAEARCDTALVLFGHVGVGIRVGLVRGTCIRSPCLLSAFCYCILSVALTLEQRRRCCQASYDLPCAHQAMQPILSGRRYAERTTSDIKNRTPRSVLNLLPRPHRPKRRLLLHQRHASVLASIPTLHIILHLLLRRRNRCLSPHP